MASSLMARRQHKRTPSLVDPRCREVCMDFMVVLGIVLTMLAGLLVSETHTGSS
jgi:hypothetical protein